MSTTNDDNDASLVRKKPYLNRRINGIIDLYWLVRDRRLHRWRGRLGPRDLVLVRRELRGRGRQRELLCVRVVHGRRTGSRRESRRGAARDRV